MTTQDLFELYISQTSNLCFSKYLAHKDYNDHCDHDNIEHDDSDDGYSIYHVDSDEFGGTHDDYDYDD